MKRRRRRGRPRFKPYKPSKSSSPPLLPPGPSEEEIKAQEEQRQRDEESQRRHEEVTAQIKKEREEKAAKIRDLDEKIRLAETELTILERSLLDAQHSLERAQIELTYRHDEASYVVANAAADTLHDTRLLLIARKVEHDRFVDERAALGSSTWKHWAMFGFLAYAAVAVFGMYMARRERPRANPFDGVAPTTGSP